MLASFVVFYVPIGVVLLILIFAPASVGGVHVWSALVCGALSVCAQCVGFFEDRNKSTSHTYAVSMLAIVAGIFGVLSLLQLIPLPAWAHAVLSPTGSEWHELGLRAFGVHSDVDRPWHTISLDPASTAQASVRWWSVALVVSLASNFIRHQHVDIVLLGLLFSGLVNAILGLAQQLSGTSLHLWFFDAGFAPRGYSTFVSMNHGASFYGLVSFAALILALRKRRGEALKAWAMVAAMASAWLMLLHGSMGVPIFLCSVSVPTLIWHVRRSTPRAPNGYGIKAAMLATLGLCVIISIMVWERHLIFEFIAYNDARLAMYVGAFMASVSFWRFGAGAGATERVIYPFTDLARIGELSIPVVEHDALEWTLNFGWLAILVVCMLVGLSVSRWWKYKTQKRMRRTDAFVLAWAVLCVLIAQVHFPSRMMGLALPMVIVWCALAYRRQKDVPRAFLMLKPQKGMWFVSTAGFLMVLSFGLSVLYKVPSDRDWLEQKEFSSKEVLEAMHFTPGEARLFMRASNDALRTRAFIRSCVLAKRAWVLEPQPYARAILAHACARAGRIGVAREHYRVLFMGKNTRRFKEWSALMLGDLEQDKDRVFVLQDMPQIWQVMSLKHVERLEGTVSASLLLFALIEAAPDELKLEEMQLGFYARFGEWALVEQLASKLILDQRKGARFDALRLLGYVHLVRALRAQGKPKAAYDMTHTGLELFPGAVELHMMMLRMHVGKEGAALYLHTGILGDVRARMDAVNRAHSIVCRGESGVQWRDMCLLAKSLWLEWSGQVTQAYEVLLERAWAQKNPNEAADLLMRHGHCAQLKKLATRWGRRHPEDVAARDRIMSRFNACVVP